MGVIYSLDDFPPSTTKKNGLTFQTKMGKVESGCTKHFVLNWFSRQKL